MEPKLNRRQTLAILSLGSIAPWSVLASVARANDYSLHPPGSMYGLRFNYPINELVWDLDHSERGDPRRESGVPYDEWYSQEIRHRFGSWGPRPRKYPPLERLEQRSLEWKQERVIATAARFIGYSYQHHHIPDWNPPSSWPWKPTCAGHNGKGFDCSNFTSFVYNQGFGIHMTANVVHQSRGHNAIEGDVAIPIQQIDLPRDYAQRQQILRTGDLVYIRGREGGQITHVVIWIGSVGSAPGDMPLIMDSHGSGVKDNQGRPIPCGVQLRPFRPDSWYDRCASHAHRIFIR